MFFIALDLFAIKEQNSQPPKPASGKGGHLITLHFCIAGVFKSNIHSQFTVLVSLGLWITIVFEDLFAINEHNSQQPKWSTFDHDMRNNKSNQVILYFIPISLGTENQKINTYTFMLSEFF